MRNSLFVMAICALLSVGAGALQAATLTWVGPATGGDWETAANWDTNTVPTSADDIVIGSGVVVEVNSADAVLNRFFGSSGAVNINNGAVLTGSSAYTLRYTAININNGGSLPTDPTWNIRTDIDINTGGVLTGTDALQDAKTLNIMGTFSPLEESSSRLEYVVEDVWASGTELNLVSGTLILDVFGDGVNEYFNMTGTDRNSSMNLSGGTIELRVADGYTPQIGDSFDLVNWADNNTFTAGDGSNIVLAGYELDTTQWASSGIVTVVPEPATMGLLALGGLAILRRRSRKA